VLYFLIYNLRFLLNLRALKRIKVIEIKILMTTYSHDGKLFRINN